MSTARKDSQADGAMLVSADVLSKLPSIDAIVFDIDGVLVDVSESFRVVTCEAVKLYAERILSWDVNAPLITPREIELIKSAGGFNSDWDVAKAVMLFYLFKRFLHGSKSVSGLRSLKPTLEEFVRDIARMGGGFKNAESYILSRCNIAMRRDLVREWNPRLVVQLFQELYAGDEWCQYLYGFHPQYVHGAGYIEREKVLIDVELIPTHLKLGILTGRTRREAELALNRCGLSNLIPPHLWMTDDDGFRKPDGRALWLLLDRMGARNAVYVGDGIDDLLTVKNYREWAEDGYPEVIFCAVLASSDKESNRNMFIEGGAEMISPNVNFLLAYLHSIINLHRGSEPIDKKHSGRRGRRNGYQKEGIGKQADEGDRSSC